MAEYDAPLETPDTDDAVPSDRIALLVWAGGAALMAVILLKDLFVSLYRAAVGS